MKVFQLDKYSGLLKIKFNNLDRDDFQRTLLGIKRLDNRYFVSSTKTWFARNSRENVERLLSLGFAKQGDFSVDEGKKNKKGKIFKKIDRKAVDSRLFNYQIKGIEFIEGTDGNCIIADDMGVGKTAQAVSWLRIRKDVKKVIIVCPSFIRIKWQRELLEWGDISSAIFYKYKPQSNVIIISYDILYKHLQELLDEGFDCIIGDEVQYISNHKAKRTKAFISLARKIKYKVFLSGTPLRNRPRELYNVLSLIAPKIFFNRWHFLQRYCNPVLTRWGWKFDGASNIDELVDLVEPYILRRKKEDVLSEIPEKQKFIIPLDLDDKYISEYAYENEKIGEIIKSEKKIKKMEIKNKFEHLKEIAYMAKRKSMLEYIDSLIKQRDKIVIFAYHRHVIKDIFSYFRNVTVVVDGSVPMKQREYLLRIYNNDSNIKIFLGQILATGLGIDLTISSTVLFSELWWVPADMEQATDRCHRIGTKDNVQIYYLIAPGTVEDEMALALTEKFKLVKRILDKEEDISFFGEEDILDLLIKKRLKNV